MRVAGTTSNAVKGVGYMYKFQAPLALRSTETLGERLKKIAVRTNVKLQVQALSDMVNKLLDEVENLQSEDTDSDEMPFLNLRDEVRRFEIDLIQRALTRSQGSQVEAARLLGLNTTTLHEKIKRYRLHLPYLIQSNDRACARK